MPRSNLFGPRALSSFFCPSINVTKCSSSSLNFPIEDELSDVYFEKERSDRYLVTEVSLASQRRSAHSWTLFSAQRRLTHYLTGRFPAWEVFSGCCLRDSGWTAGSLCSDGGRGASLAEPTASQGPDQGLHPSHSCYYFRFVKPNVSPFHFIG